MPRFTLTQLMMGIVLAPIILVLAQSEGCDVPKSSIDSLSFSADGSRIAVSNISERDRKERYFYEPPRFFRTISWLDAENGKTIRIVHHDSKKELSTNDYRKIKGSAVCCPVDDRIAAFEFDDDKLNLDVRSGEPFDKDGSYNGKLEFSRSGKYLALTRENELIVLDIANEAILQSIPLFNTRSGTYVHAYVNPYAFSDDESKLIVCQDRTTEVWDIESQTQVSSTKRNWHSYLGAIATVPDDTLIACKGGSLERMDFSGNRLALLSLYRYYFCSVSKYGSAFAASRHDEVDVFDLATNTRQATMPLGSAEAIAISHDGNSVAVGHKGKVLLFDTKTGNEIWSAVPPIHNGTPWPVPFACFIAWCIVATVLWRKRNSVDNNKQ